MPVSGVGMDFRLPAPYVLEGQTPNTMHHDVKLILEAAARRGILAFVQKGLVLQLETSGVNGIRLYITFDAVDGEHRFHEASGQQMHFGEKDLVPFLQYLETLGFQKRLPALPE